MATADRIAEVDNDTLEQNPGPFEALYKHWERHQWSPYDIDLTTDAESFQALTESEQQGFIWVFSHRFTAESQVALQLAPFLEHAPDWAMQIAISTQIADEHRHLQSVLRVYEEVFGVTGGVDTVAQIATDNMDVVMETLEGELQRWVGGLRDTGTPEAYFKAVNAYHLAAEGVIARTAQNLTAGQYQRFGTFPGLTEGQRHVARDEARHIGIGVAYVRRVLEQEPAAREWLEDVMDAFATQATELLETALAADMHDQVVEGYGVEPIAFYEEGMRLLRMRLRSVGYLTD